MLINMMEHYVDERLLQLIGGYECCKCEICMEDMRAYALNRLPAKYVSSMNGQLYTRISQELENQHGVDLDVCVIQAIESVSAAPRHGGKR